MRTLSREEIEAIRDSITPVNQIPMYRNTRTLFPPEKRTTRRHMKYYRRDN